MGKGFRHAVTVITFAVALMSGILSLLREFLLFQYPTRFQEAPLFWGCLRIAFGMSLIALWYEERRKRLALESKSLQGSQNPKSSILALSAEVLDFLYERRKNAPPVPVWTFQPYGEDATVYWAEAQKTTQQQLAISAYARETLEIFTYKYGRLVREAVVFLKKMSLDTARIEGCLQNLSNESNPDYEGIRIPAEGSIKTIGEHLGILADQIAIDNS